VSFLSQLDWIWPAFALAFLCGVLLTRWWLLGRVKGDSKVNQDYFKGLNFLLNEEPDKAIEVFIKALEVDSETVELHLALGGLFRRKGQVDRATRIHQNLIARPTLTDDQRVQAIYELAQDYYKAGLLDRAENLFIELKDSISFREAALRGLCNIYQQEKEWKKAIEVSRLHKRSERLSHTKRIAHYWCELAEYAINMHDYDAAQKYLRSALSENRSAARAVMLRGELSYQQKNYRRAMDSWQSLSVSNPTLASLLVEKIILCYRQLDDAQGLENYLLNIATIPKELEAFQLWRSSLENILGERATLDRIFTQIQSEGLSGAVADYLYQNADSESFPTAQKSALLKDLLGRAKNRKIEYTCIGCGFDTKALYWFCANCGEWESFS
jgi:lipopolysaccharide biosynthesis regulator YciM